MIKTDLEYNFHDSVVIRCDQKKEDRFILSLQLCEIFYPLNDSVKIVFSGVFNQEKVSRFFSDLKMDNIEPDWNGHRINSIEYDTKKTSKDLNLYLFVDIDGFEPITIHCKKIRIEKIG